MPHAEFSTLAEMLTVRAERDPDKVGYTFLADGELDERPLTYRRLHERARAIAAGLRSHVAAGDRVLLLCPPGLEFIQGFFGCLYAGVIAVPAFPPDPSAPLRMLRRIEAIAADCSPAAILTTAEFVAARELLTVHAPALAKLPLLGVESCADVPDGPTDGAVAGFGTGLGTDPGDVAFLQYTSGSTGSPKGVMLTHENILHNEAMINTAMPQGPDSILVSWLPLFHDMGLIGIALNTAYLGARCVFMAPQHFLQRPRRWLDAVTRHRATLTGAPNFGFELCLRKIGDAELAELDLSSVQAMFNGAEPVRADTLERFAARFAPCGFRREALTPCYGLAEATLVVSSVKRQDLARATSFDPVSLESGLARPSNHVSADDASARRLVSVGTAAGDQVLVIVDPDSRRIRPPGALGEIWVAGPNLGRGYWHRPEESAEVFAARLEPSAESDAHYLRTGDLGFLHEGELYIAGRLKDLVIVRGRNLAPQDLEFAVEEAFEGLRPGCGAVFQTGPDDAAPLLVSVHEFDARTGGSPQDAISAARSAVAAEFEVELDAVVLIEPRTIPKTSSGKIQRRACRAAFENGRLAVVARWDAGTEATPGAENGELAERIETALREHLARVAGLPPDRAPAADDLSGLGLDSLTAVELGAQLQRELGVSVPLIELLRGQDIATLSRRIASGVAASRADGVLPRESATRFPLSDGQLALWYLHQQDPESTAYNVPVALCIRRPLDLTLLHQSLDLLVERHEALRTRLGQDAGVPYQEVLEGRAADFQQQDAEAWSPESLRAALAQDADTPFDLGQDPLLRIRVYRKSEEETYLLLVVHHIVADLWSLAQLADELGLIYRSLSENALVDLPPTGSRYADFVRWQATWLGTAEAATQLDAWAHDLTPLPEPLLLPTDRSRPPVQTANGSSVLRRLDPALAAEVREFARRGGVTSHALLLTVFQTLLHRYTGQTDIVVGTPSAMRERAEFGDVFGFFVNTLPVRLDLSGDPRFDELLGRSREAVLGAIGRQRIPFVRIVERIRPARDASRSPVFQVMYVHQQSQFADPARSGLAAFALGEEGGRADLHGLEVESVRIERRSSQFDLLLMSAQDEAGLSLSLEFNTDLFDPDTAARILGHFEQLLRHALADPACRLSELRLLTPRETAEIDSWNQTARDYPEAGWIHEQFSARAAAAPEATALVFEGSRMDYRDLDRRSNQLAHRLRRLGIGPGDFVGIALERSFDLVVGLLGILKSGAAYLPLDLEHPAERLAGVLADAAPSAVLTLSHLRPRLPDGEHRWIELDTGPAPLTEQDDTAPAVGLAASDGAYLIYTSGSTGRPKGVVTSHGAIGNRLAWMQETYRCEAGDRVAQKTPAGFDVSVWEFFWPLMNGATLVLARPGGHRDAAYLADLITRERVTVAHFVPSMLQLFLAEPEAERCASLRQVICSGETLQLDLARHFARALPGCALDNLYGPTEAAVDVTSWHFRPDEDRTFVPIGRPIANTVVRLLDPAGNLVPVGVPGELYIGGAAPARGYHHLADLTAERFVPDRFVAAPDARLYRTGDLARYHADGSIEYLGRTDHQTKIHGNRVELGEIETVLAGHPGVLEAVVVTHGAGAQARLVAYVTLAGPAQPDDGDLRAHIGRLLPQYMVPNLFVTLPALPLSPSGKVDRTALPEPGGARRPATAAVAPRTPEEQVLSRVLGEVLGLGEIGVTDNFFEFGGDSIRALQARVLARAAGLDLSIADLLQYQTVERLAKAVRPTVLQDPAAAAGRAPFSLLSAEDRAKVPATAVDGYPLAMLQEGLVFHSETSPDYEIYVMGFHLGGRFDQPALRAALDRLTARHALLRTSFDFTTFSESMQVVHATATVPLTVHDLTGLSGETGSGEVAGQAEVDRFMREQKWRKFDWTTAPLLRVDVHVRSEQSFQCTFSHPLFDGWSMALLITELMADYGVLARGGQPEDRPELRLAYADFVALEQEAIASTGHREFWAGYLAGADRSEIPRRPSRRRPAPARHRRSTVTVGADVAQGLRRLAGDVGAPLKSVVLAAHLRVVSVLTGRTDVTTGMIANGRPEELDGERVPGVFLNTVPLRMGFPGGTWRDLVRQTLAAEREVLAFRRYPLAELVRTAGAGRPLFETCFNYIHFHIYEALLNVDGLEVLDWSSPSDQTYFPLTAYFHQDVSSGDLLCFLDFDEAVFDPDQIAAVREYYLAALTAMAQDPDARYERRCLLPAAERELQSGAWNRTELPWPAGRPEGVHRRFAAAAAADPAATAVRAADGSLTYAELEARANQLAHRLRALGAGPGTNVGISLGRTTNLLVALLGVLKSGAAYVPMDPRFPQERLRHMLADSGAAIIVTDTVTASATGRTLPEAAVRLLLLDAENELLGAQPTDAPSAPFDPDGLAYVIYTSGSTGVPKGVEISHRALDNLLLSFEREFEWTADEVLLAVTTLSFDIAGLELFLPLSTGARLELADETETAAPERLAERISVAGVTTMQATPASWRMLVDSGWKGSPTLRVVCGGEELTARLAEELVPRGAELWNVYGPTETTIWSTAARLDRVDGAPVIGRPLANTTVHVLDGHGEPAPIGTPGELYIGGTGLARGYRNRPDLTAAAFAEHAWAPDSGPGSGPAGGPNKAPTRLYRTGDLVRYRPDGALEYLGRRDSQVKVRGFRIELGEIESVLGRLPQLRRAVAAARPDGSGQSRLVAYVVPEPGAEVDVRELRAAVAASLPPYMVPGVFEVLDELPHTPNGKVDRRALPEPSGGRPAHGPDFAAPRSECEERLTLIWREVLRVDQVGIDDHFFDLGGHSLLTVRTHSRIRREVADIPLTSLFEYPTVRRLAGYIADRGAPDDRLHQVRDRARQRRGAARGTPGAPSAATTVDQRRSGGDS